MPPKNWHEGYTVLPGDPHMGEVWQRTSSDLVNDDPNMYKIVIKDSYRDSFGNLKVTCYDMTGELFDRLTWSNFHLYYKRIA